MGFVDLAKERFSARSYTAEPVAQADLDYILEAVRLAPSAVNRQPWKFLVVRSEDGLKKARECYDRPWFATAPLVVIALKNVEAAWVRPDDGKNHADIDLAIAIEHLCLAATERGLGTCWVCNYSVEKFARLFPQPEGWEAVAFIPVGHKAADCVRAPRPRKPLGDIVEEA